MVNGAISTFRIQDAFDIVIMAFIIYHLVTLMKETRAGQLIKGVLVILLLYFFAYVLELYTLRTVMEMVIRYGALVLLVLFQPELRKVLEQVGRSSLSNLSVLAPNMNGGERPFVVTGLYERYLPMDIYPMYLLKACLAGDIDKMENLGIYEVVEEDFALCEFVDPSKIEIQQIIRDGINLMIKEA